jgi:hypothetical protein
MRKYFDIRNSPIRYSIFPFEKGAIMDLTQLRLETLNDVKGGLIGVMLAKALNRIASDLKSGDDLPDARKLKLEIRFKPVVENKRLVQVDVDFGVSTTLPARGTHAVMLVGQAERGDQQLFFSLDSPGNPRQGTLLPAEEERSEK